MHLIIKKRIKSQNVKRTQKKIHTKRPYRKCCKIDCTPKIYNRRHNRISQRRIIRETDIKSN